MPTEPRDPIAFVDELRARIRQMLLDELPADASGELVAKRLDELLLVYGNWRARHVRAVPRTPHVSGELAASPKRVEHQAAVDAIVAKIIAGDDLTPHLSRGIKTALARCAGSFVLMMQLVRSRTTPSPNKRAGRMAARTPFWTVSRRR